MLDHNALAYISKAEVAKVANKIVKPMEALNLPIPLYVKLLSSVDERLIEQVKTLEDAQFLAWCLPENVNPELCLLGQVPDVETASMPRKRCSIKYSVGLLWDVRLSTKE